MLRNTHFAKRLCITRLNGLPLQRSSLHSSSWSKSFQLPDTTKCVHRLKVQSSSQSRFHRHGLVSMCGVISARHNSTQPPSSLNPEGYIPEIPKSLESITDNIVDPVLNKLGEVSLADQGLCNYTPAGFVQWALETMHVGLDVPWWGAIAIGTLIVRSCVFPLVIQSRKSVIHTSNHMPVVTRLQEKFSKARSMGNNIEAGRIAQEISSYIQRNEVKPFRSFKIIFIQAPVFISFFIGIRGMCNLPVDSMVSGGLFWFKNLTVPDPYYILPLMTSATLLATMEAGSDGVSTAQMTPTMKWVMRMLPVFFLPFMAKFPAGMLCYWLTTNLFSLGQVLILKIPKVEKYFNMPKRINHEAVKLKFHDEEKVGFVQKMKETYNNSKVLSDVEKRKTANIQAFQQAGKAPLRKTYSYNPKQKQ